jgi:uncharacterized membrane protein YfcA
VSLDQLIIPALVLLLAGFIKGVIGLGLPAVGVGLLGLVMAPVQAAALLVVPSTITNVWQLWDGPNFRGLLRRLWPMLLGILVGGWLGGGTLAGANTGRVRFFLGLVLVAYAIYGLLARRADIPRRWEKWLGPVIGVLTGIVTTATGLSMLPAVPYITGLGLNRDDMVQAMGLSFTASTLSLAADLAGSGHFDRPMILASALALLPALAGMQFGTYVRARISPVLFRRCFYSGMLVLGLELARH